MAIKYLDAKRIRGSSTAEGALGTGLKAYYKFDESSGNIVNVANTITGNSTLGTGQNITMNGDPTYSVTGTPSSFGNAVSCDGSGDYGQFGTKTDWNFLHTTGATWTINVWLKFDATVAGNKQLFDNTRAADSTIGLNIRTQASDKFRVIIPRGVGNSSTLDTDNNPNLPIPTDNEWHMYTFRWDQSSGNGVLTYNTDASNEVTANGSGNGTTTSDCTDSPRLFSLSNSVSGEVDAEIAEMSIYNTVLTDANLTSLYNSGAGRLLTTAGAVDEKTTLGTSVYAAGLGTSADITTSGAGTLGSETGSGGPFTSGSELQTSCFNFNGSTRVRTGNLQLLPRSDFTFAFWTKADSFSTSGSNSPRWLHGDGNTAIIELGNNANPKIVNFQLSTASGTNALEVAHGMSTGTWYHWAFVYDASNGDMIIYRDGSAIGTDTSNPYSLPINAHTSWWEMGGGGSEYMDGQMNDIAIWNKKLTSTQIGTLYGNGGSTVKRATSVDKENIVAYWDGSDTTLTVPNAAIPTTTYDLPENTIFEETDTRKYYFLQDNVWEESPKPYYETSFTSSSTEWDIKDTGKQSIDTSGGTLDFDIVRDGSCDCAAYDLGKVITSTSWKLRCSFKFTANVASGGNVGAGNGFYFGLSDGNKDICQNSSQDYIGAQIYRDNQDTLGGIDCDSATMPRIYDGEDEHSIDIGNTTTTYYLQVQRTSSSAYNVKLWTGGYDGTLVGDASCSNASGISNLRYIKIQNEDTQNIGTSTDLDIEVYEVKFYE